MTPGLSVATTATAAVLGPYLRARIFTHSVAYGQPHRTRCPRCRLLLTASWRSHLPSSGRCPRCGRRIGPAAGTVEICAAIVVGVLAWRSRDPATFAAAAWVAVHGIVMAFVDATVHRLPDTLTLSAFTGAATILFTVSAVTGSYTHLASAFIGSAAMAGFYFLLVLLKPHELGLGDAKLALVVGLTLGWLGAHTVVLGLIGAILVGLIVGLSLRTARRLRSDHAFAFGPAMLIGALVAYTLQAPGHLG
jgi:leader peptidase (prepilin peptidase)/N-methyltransferase